MKRKWAIGALVLIGAVLTLSGCAAEANHAGSFFKDSTAADCVAGLLQGFFVLWVALINVVFGATLGFHTDLYQENKGFAYQLCWLIGAFLWAGPAGFFLFRWRRRHIR